MINRITILLTISVLVGLGVACRGPSVPLTRQDLQATLIHGDLKRNYILHLPEGHPAIEKKALLVVLHGGGGSSRGMIKLTQGRFNALADQNGFFVVYPEATHKQWNDERNDRTSRVHRQGVDDVGFLLTLIRSLKAEYPVDPRRVFVAGISNGGMMALRLTCEASAGITAIAVVTAALPESFAQNCPEKKPVSLLLINGTEDPLVPYDGGEIVVFGKNRGRVLSTNQTIRLWSEAAGCSPIAVEKQLPDTQPDDGTRVRVINYHGCKEGVSVSLFRIEGGGHTWPGGWQYLHERFVGKTSRDIDACAEIWKFFNQF